MPELTATEVIATKLMGWEAKGKCWCSHETCLNSSYMLGRKHIVIENGRSFSEFPVNVNGWPDLTDWNDIRKMEDAIDDKGLLWLYDGILKDSFPAGTSRYEYTATAERRVAAALITIEEAGL